MIRPEDVGAARAVAESLIPAAELPQGWAARWDRLEQLVGAEHTDDELRRAYISISNPSGHPEADALATACMVRGVDI